MLNPPTNTNTVPPAAPILPGATVLIRRQAAFELIRLRRKLTPPGSQMSYFTRASVSRPMGRPLGHPVTTFAAMLHARLSGHSRKRAVELLTADPNRASGAVWSIASQAAADGVQTAEQFEAWLQREDQPSQS